MKRMAAIVLLAGVTGCLHRSPEQAVLASYKGDRASISGDSAVCTKPSARQDTAGVDTAIVRVFQDCVKTVPPCPTGQSCANSFRVETDYLVVKKNGRWIVDRPISGGVIVLM